MLVCIISGKNYAVAVPVKGLDFFAEGSVPLIRWLGADLNIMYFGFFVIRLKIIHNFVKL